MRNVVHLVTAIVSVLGVAGTARTAADESLMFDLLMRVTTKAPRIYRWCNWACKDTVRDRTTAHRCRRFRTPSQRTSRSLRCSSRLSSRGCSCTRSRDARPLCRGMCRHARRAILLRTSQCKSRTFRRSNLLMRALCVETTLYLLPD